ncbi:hypothetical protein D4764_10G0003260 [Takifugu flavidus]|uniref:Uncharacterized protein n=1 Tax=Takifugu flavidus TaxID=433684 RepID=A0A5C6PK31_9TELE|nr:hypothetical protein D4764_10G0003260 [Takifugu flavidus]
MACADVDMDIHGTEEPSGADCNQAPGGWCFRPLEMTPESKRSLHDVLQKHPGVFGSLQVMSGLVSFGLGITFAVSLQMEYSLGTIFRVSHLSGIILIFAGSISSLWFKCRQLFQVLLVVNCGCMIVATIAMSLIIVDLTGRQQPRENELIRLELLEVCILLVTIILSGILAVSFFKQKRSKSL